MTIASLRVQHILAFILLLFVCYTVNSQTVKYFEDFDFYTLQGKRELPENKVSNFYIKCFYDEHNTLVKLIAFGKKSWDAYPHPAETISICNNIDSSVKILFFGAGKTRTGYTRKIFQSKDFVSDSALITHDTLIYKSLHKENVIIQIYSKINSDTIHFSRLSFSIRRKEKKDIKSIYSLSNYKTFFQMDSSAYNIVGGEIKLKKDPILVWQNIKPADYSGLINITKGSLKDDEGMPISLFWLKASGLLY